MYIVLGIGATPPSKGGSNITASSPAVSQANTTKCAQTRKVAILLENGYNYSEVKQVMEGLRSAGVKPKVVSMNHGAIKTSKAKRLLNGIKGDKYQNHFKNHIDYYRLNQCWIRVCGNCCAYPSHNALFAACRLLLWEKLKKILSLAYS